MTPDCIEKKHCRVCNYPLVSHLHFGMQALGGQFPGPADPLPERFPLVLARCSCCGLIQLAHTVKRELLFSRYWYRSGVTATMRRHLGTIVEAGRQALGREPGSVLDIGCNDGTLLRYADSLWQLPSIVGVEPSNQLPPPGPDDNEEGMEILAGFYPDDLGTALKGRKFDLIFTVACFYDADDPVAFAEAVRDNLAEDGIWVVEVGGDWMLEEGIYDVVCHEHLLYLNSGHLQQIGLRAGLTLQHYTTTGSNGGSVLCFFSHNPRSYPCTSMTPLRIPAEKIHAHREEMLKKLRFHRNLGRKVHLLGASTKANTWLQYCGVGEELIQAASDRDPRKRGRHTPGTMIPIVAEEESRELSPDVYVVGPWHFREEILQREQEFLKRGGRMIFPFPTVEEIRHE